ncbi:unnamed protein product [Arabidopsis thaliana]|uniref:Uncharacterized protein n=1 Tax=Arabidopsis thaliana TaxID=3702 RepID=A0A5S9WSC2_ARATH|nr:unnamed protein product [Arabidopsis thaliana]
MSEKFTKLEKFEANLQACQVKLTENQSYVFSYTESLNAGTNQTAHRGPLGSTSSCGHTALGVNRTPTSGGHMGDTKNPPQHEINNELGEELKKDGIEHFTLLPSAD